jgi:hypothetical protein
MAIAMIDYIAGAKGANTTRAAADKYAREGQSIYVTALHGDSARAVISDAHGSTVKVLVLFNAGHGWLVSTTRRCAASAHGH